MNAATYQAGDIAHLTRAAMLADDLFSAELVATYGKREACNARYDSRGYATPELRRLHRDKRAADYACHCAWCATRGDKPAPMAPLPY